MRVGNRCAYLQLVWPQSGSVTPTLMKSDCTLHWIDARGMENGVSLDATFSTKVVKYYLLGGVKGGAQAPPF